MVMKSVLLLIVVIGLTVYLIRQCRKPHSLLGRFFLWEMGQRHMDLTGWGLSHVAIKSNFRILDVGCGDGVFLSCISDEWLRQGLEPSASGVTLARQKNLDVQQATLDTVQDKYEVDVISALDVVEHVVDPHQFLESFKPHLRPGGVVLLLTGDADSYAARIAGPHWSYLRWCGHISVLSRTGLRKLLQSHGFEILAWDRCDHPSSSGAVAWWRVHLLEPVRRLLGRNRSWYPFWRDHQMVVARLS